MATRDERKALMAQSLDSESAQTGAVTLTFEQITQLVNSAVSAAVAAVQPGGDVGAQMAEAIRANREKMPENSDADNPNISHYHPGGNAVTRPVLTLPTYFGVWDTDGRKAIPAFELLPSTLRDDEIEALNWLPTGTFSVERLDGAPMTMRVVDHVDSQDVTYRRVLAFPQQQYEKDHRNMIPSVSHLARQVLAMQSA